MKLKDINFLFESLLSTQAHIDTFNKKLNVLEEKRRRLCTILPTDSNKKIRKKCKQARQWGVYYAPVWNTYVTNTSETPPESTTSSDTNTDVSSEVSELKGLAGSKFTYPMSSGPDDDYQQKPQNEADTSTERVRRYYRRHPEKVRKYLKDTVKDRVARNRDRAKAVRKYGKKKMKNHDVHHPNGPNGGSWRLAKKDHGRDKKNENYVYLEELLEGNVPYDSWILISEGGAAGHMAHPYEDNELTFADVKEMVRRGLVGELDAEEPVTEKLDGQNIMFTVRDGQVVFARNKGQVKNRGRTALDAAGISQMFAGRGGLQKAFGGAAEDLQRAIDALPQEQRDEMFRDGSNFMNVEIILPDTQNVIPYGKSVLVFHGTVEYDDEGNEVGRSTENGRTLADQITRVNAQQQQTFGISGPRTISFSDAQTVRNKRALKEIGAEIARLQEEYDLDDNSTIEDYKLAWWENKLIEISQQTGIDFTEEEFEGITRRWALGDKSFGVKDIEDSDKKKWFREFEAKELKQMQQQAVRPLESVFLRTGALSLLRVTDLLSANNPEAAVKLKQQVLDTIREIQKTDDRNKLAALQTQIERLEDVGIDSIVPSEGMVFIYNGKPYKFTGAFAPVNQILGTLKFDKGKATVVEPDPDTERSTDEPPVQPPTPPGEHRTVAVFTGRFQPFHAGHYSIYQELVKRFGRENVFIATSDKTEAGRSPFGFRDKEEIMTRMFDIPEEMIVQVKNPYAPVEVLETLPPGTTYVTAVSQKDADRLSGGKYFQEYDPKTSTAGYADKGYFIVAPEMQLSIDGRNISGTQLRAIMGNPDITDEVKKEIFTKVYGKFDQTIFDKVKRGATRAEEERKITATHSQTGVSGKKSEPSEQPSKQRKQAGQKQIGASYHKSGTTWPVGKKFAGKNSKGLIRYFRTQTGAEKFAKT